MSEAVGPNMIRQSRFNSARTRPAASATGSQAGMERPVMEGQMSLDGIMLLASCTLQIDFLLSSRPKTVEN